MKAKDSTVNVDGIFLDESQYEGAKHCSRMSARIRKLTLGYWPPEQQLFVAARKPKGMSESTFRKITWRDYENIRTIVMKLQGEQSTRISGLSDEDINLETIKRYVHATLKKKRYTEREREDEEETEGLLKN
ncbi:uncharacterized protein LOC117177256 [Belonocnema kinseyi]|uniref:uncharacterized protein LOC117177256 n=1 Tax=Belonocnema kinseyi TaxID=2817044 RepID=UPI00143CDC7D|nr:uncharacterized protein LOC117177256 [Belonocnema kinseyi]